MIEKAKKENMPKENIDRAVAKGISADANSLDQITYETYGPGGAAIIIETVTDSRNRTAQEIKHLLSELGLALAAPGSRDMGVRENRRRMERQNDRSPLRRR